MNNEYCIYGRKPVLEAIQAERPIDKIMMVKTAQGTDMHEIAAIARQRGITVQYVPAEKIEFSIRKFARQREANHQGVVALMSLLENLSVEDVLQRISATGQEPFIVVLDGVTDVGNFGAIARSAYCFGAQAIIMPAKGSAPVSPEAIKTSAGALERIMIARVDNIAMSIKLLKAHGVAIVGASEKASTAIDAVNFKKAFALVLGDEGEGISNVVFKQCDTVFNIPMASDFDSLNVSVSAGVSFYEAMKQRRGL